MNIDEQVQRSFDRDAVWDAVIFLAQACVPYSKADPEDDERG